METKKASRIKASTKVFLIALALTVIFSICNWGSVTGWGNVKIEEIQIAGDNGTSYTGLMYIPANATNETPAPALLTLMGASGNARNHEVYAVEYARRGFVVLSVDNCGSGDSTYDKSIEDISKTNNPKAFWEYLMTCPFVDKERTVINGHSVGSTGALHLAAWYNPTVCVPIDGFMGVVDPKHGMHYTGNICAINGDADNQNIDKYLAPLGKLFQKDERIVIEGEFEYNKLYGSFEEGNAKILNMVHSGHEDAMISAEGMQVQLDFVQKCMEVPNPIEGSDQIWLWKDILGLLGMLTFAFTLIALAVVLIDQVKWFESIKQPMPRNIGLRGKGLVISIACAIIFPLIVLRTGTFGLTKAMMQEGFLTSIFGMGRANRAFTVVIGMSLMGVLPLLLFIFTDAKKQKATIREFGLTSEGSTKLDLGLIGKSFVLTLVVLFVGFALLRMQREILGTDFYSLYFGFKPIAWNKFIPNLPYLIVWPICFALSAVGMNVERRLADTGNETKDTIIACVVNVFLAVVTITVVISVQQYLQKEVLFRTAGAMSNWAADLTRLWGMPVGMTIGTVGNTYLYRKTGNIWPGVFLMGILCAFACVLYGGYNCYF